MSYDPNPTGDKKVNKNGKVYAKLDKNGKPTNGKASKLKDAKGNIIDSE